MTDKEQKDLYIAAGVLGVGILAIFLISNHTAAVAAAADPTNTAAPASLTDAPPPLPTPYNYNIAPYNNAPAIKAVQNPSSSNNGGCCDNCGPINGNKFNNPGVPQYNTLMGFGADAGTGWDTNGLI
jgi:hypothetical protein